MTIVGVKQCVTDLIKSMFPKMGIYSIMKSEGFNRPAFFIYMKPVIDEPENYNTRHLVYNVYIDYFQAVKDEYDAMTVMAQIRDAFGLFITDKDGHTAKTTDFSFDYVGVERNVPEAAITLEWFEQIEHDRTAPTMETLTWEQTLKEVYNNGNA